MKPATKAEVMAEKQDAIQTAREESVKSGTCPRCGAAVMFSSWRGVLTVVEAFPIPEEAEQWWPVDCYSVSRNRLHRRTLTYVEWAKGLAVHPEHVACGRVIPVAVPAQRAEVVDDGGWPPFDPLLCCVCRVWFTAEERRQRAWVGFYVSSSQWWAAHDSGCPSKPAEGRTALSANGPRLRYPKINPLTGDYETPRKGEVGYVKP